MTPSLKSRLASALDSQLERSSALKEQSDLSSARIHAVVAGVTSPTETLYLNAKGVANTDKPDLVTVDHVMSFFSCTKALTATAILQLYDQGKLNVDSLASNYLSKIGEIGLIDEDLVSDEDGSFLTPPRPPKNAVTIKHLLTHTSGFAYAFTNSDYFLLMTKRNPHINAVKPTAEFFNVEKMPLVFEPGSQFLYGHSSDWLGLIVQEITGKPLGEYLKENLFKPVGMDTCTFHLTDENVKFMKLHSRTRKKGIVIHKSYVVDRDPVIDMGGQGCFGTVGDYLKFMRVWLNNGTSPDTGVTILQPSTIEYAKRNHLPSEFSLGFDTAVSSLLDDDSKLDGFTLAGCAYNVSRLPTGRPEGSIYWSGLGNLFFG